MYFDKKYRVRIEYYLTIFLPQKVFDCIGNKLTLFRAWMREISGTHLSHSTYCVSFIKLIYAIFEHEPRLPEPYCDANWQFS